MFNFRRFKLKPFLTHLACALVYPCIVLITAEKKLLKLTDALTITGLIFLVIGIVYSLIRHGDFDIMEYVSRRSANREQVKPFAAFKDDKKEKRKDSMNYPFWIGILLLLGAAVLAFCVY